MNDLADLLKEKFVSVAINGLYTGTGNSCHVETPGGQVLGTDPREALSKWKSLPEADRKTISEKPEMKRPSYPPNGLVVRVFQRYLKRLPGGEFDRISVAEAGKIPGWGYGSTLTGKPIYQEPMPDTMWLTEAEWTSFVPQSGEKGYRYAVPARARNKIFRFHLTNGVTSLPHLWTPDQVKSGDLMLTVIGGAKGAIRLQVEGSALLEAGKEVYDARLSGTLEYDTRRLVFSRFDIVAVGDYHRADPSRGTSGLPMGIAFEVADGKTAPDLVPPKGINMQNFSDYLDGGKR